MYQKNETFFIVAKIQGNKIEKSYKWKKYAFK